MANEIRVRVKRRFMSPLNNRLAAVDSVLNVPRNQFWLRRIADKDCEILKSVKKEKGPAEKPQAKAKGSK